MKHKLNDSTTKNQILQWINTTLETNETKIQSLGNGIIYCLLINHYYGNIIPKNKIIMVPRNSMDNKANLRKVQQALTSLNIKSITFDIFRVSEMSYLDNYQLINKLYKHFEEFSKILVKQQQQISNKVSQNDQNLPKKQNPNQIQNFILPKQLSKSTQYNSGLLTPMKCMKFFDQNTKLRCQALKLMQEIKTIVKSQTESDKIKVKNLKKMLGLIQQQSQQQQMEIKQLFSDCKKKQQIITID